MLKTSHETRQQLLQRDCVEVDLGYYGQLRMTVDEYNDLQRTRYNQQLWARRAHPVEHLKPTPDDQGTRITHLEAYNAQMRVLTGLDEPPLSTSTAAG